MFNVCLGPALNADTHVSVSIYGWYRLNICIFVQIWVISVWYMCNVWILILLFIYCFRCTICVLLCALCVGKENHINSNASVVFCVCVCGWVGGGGGGGGGGGVSVVRYTTPIHWRHDGEKIANEANHLKSIPRPLWLRNLSCEYFSENVL